MRRALALLIASTALLPATAVAAAPKPGATAAKPANPCLEPAQRMLLRCPDLTMTRPFGLRTDVFVRPGRVVLRAGNSVNSVGAGPAELFGVRSSRSLMKARQRIYRRRGGRLGIATGARLFFKAIPGQGHYWKYLHAAQFDLYRLDSRGRRVKHVKRGPKVSYCLRDLKHTRPGKARSPRRRVYEACNRSARTRKVRLGTSVGWSDVYPPTYDEQWIDVTGLRGCFAYVHTADPRNGVYESNERNNSAAVTVRLPFRAGRQHCPASEAAPEPAKRRDEYGGGY
ncbi:MAG: lysyl oxidase family protein [Thermoleophilaceae bacterium]